MWHSVYVKTLIIIYEIFMLGKRGVTVSPFHNVCHLWQTVLDRLYSPWSSIKKKKKEHQFWIPLIETFENLYSFVSFSKVDVGTVDTLLRRSLSIFRRVLLSLQPRLEAILFWNCSCALLIIFYCWNYFNPCIVEDLQTRYGVREKRSRPWV